ELAKLWEVSDTDGDNDLDAAVLHESSARLFLSHHPGCVAVSFVDDQGTIRWSFGSDLSDDAVGKSLRGDPVVSFMGDSGGSTRTSVSKVFTSVRGMRKFRAAVYVREGKHYAGALMATYDIETMLRHALADVQNLDANMVISQGSTVVFQSAAPDQVGTRWMTNVDVPVQNAMFNLRVWPNDRLVASEVNHLPDVALLLGCIVSLLWMTTVHFAQAAKLRSLAVEYANGQLFKEACDRRQAEEVAKESQARLSGVLDMSGDAIISVDPQQKITLYNHGAELLFGYTKEEIIGQPLDMLIPMGYRHAHRADIANLANRDVGIARMGGNRVVHALHKDGRHIPVDASISTLHFRGDTIFTAILRDMTERMRAEHELVDARNHLEQRVQERTAELETANFTLLQEIAERKQAEDALRASERRLQAILDNSRAIIYIKDVEGRFLSVNRWCETLFHKDRGELIGKSDYDIFPKSIADALRNNDREVLRDCRPVELEEVTHVDGEVHHYLTTKFPILAEDGQLIGLCGMSTDMTRQKQTEEALRQLSGRLLQLQDEERRRIARELHDSTAQYLAAIALNIAAIQELLPVVVEGKDDARNIIQETMSQVELCSTEIRTMSYLLHPPLLDDLGLQSALQWYIEGFTKRSRIPVQFESSGDASRLPSEMERTLYRIVQESLNNVRRHSGASSAYIYLSRFMDVVTLEVTDNGKGMPFSDFQDAKTTVAVLGVGIAGMRERVRQLGGELQITSSEDGTTIRTILPVSQQRNAFAAASV
ncbi:MAG TPA: PAS domain S-box protein, partial [Terriglobales bacterium]